MAWGQRPQCIRRPAGSLVVCRAVVCRALSGHALRRPATLPVEMSGGARAMGDIQSITSVAAPAMSIMVRGACLVLAALAGWIGPIHADAPDAARADPSPVTLEFLRDDLPPGTLTRVSLDSTRVTGWVRRLDVSGLFLETRPRTSWSRCRTRSRGTPSSDSRCAATPRAGCGGRRRLDRSAGLRRGGERDQTLPGLELFCNADNGDVARVTLIAAGAGALAGGLIGALVPRWDAVRLDF